MTAVRLSPSLWAYEPELDPTNVGVEDLKEAGWPDTLVKIFLDHRFGSKTQEQIGVPDATVGGATADLAVKAKP